MENDKFENSLKVLYIEDSTQSYEAIRLFLEQLNYQILPIISNLSDAKKNIQLENPDIVLVDLKLRDEKDDISKTVKFIEALRKERPKLPILVHSGESNLRIDAIRAVISAGVSYLVKEAVETPEHLDRAIRIALTGGVVFDWQIVRFLDEIALNKAPNMFTPRELDVIELVSEHKTNKQIAVELHISPARVNELITSILRKLGVGRRTEILEWYLDQKNKGLNVK